MRVEVRKPLHATLACQELRDTLESCRGFICNGGSREPSREELRCLWDAAAAWCNRLDSIAQRNATAYAARAGRKRA